MHMGMKVGWLAGDVTVVSPLQCDAGFMVQVRVTSERTSEWPWSDRTQTRIPESHLNLNTGVTSPASHPVRAANLCLA